VEEVSDECHIVVERSVPDLSQRRASINNNLNSEMVMMWDELRNENFGYFGADTTAAAGKELYQQRSFRLKNVK
jgi:hypothetical protein